MGYGRFEKKEEEIMEIVLKVPIHARSIRKDYPYQIKSLLRRKMIKRIGDEYRITERGAGAIRQQIPSGRYWLSPLR